MKLYGSILTELNERNVIRTPNNPLGDYVKWIFANKYSFSLESSSTKGVDVKYEVNIIRYQIKSRRVYSNNFCPRQIDLTFLYFQNLYIV